MALTVKKVMTIRIGLLAVLLALLDFATGPYIMFPIAYVVPVALAGWFLGMWPTVFFAVALPICRLIFVSMWEEPDRTLNYGVINFLIRVVVLVSLGVMMDIIARQHRQLVGRLRILEGNLPVCLACRKIRNDGGEWEPLEAFLAARSEAKFSKCVCEECSLAAYPAAYRDDGDPPHH
jgi:hypothetical protein